MGKRFDWGLLAAIIAVALVSKFYLMVPHPHIKYSGDAKYVPHLALSLAHIFLFLSFILSKNIVMKGSDH